MNQTNIAHFYLLQDDTSQTYTRTVCGLAYHFWSQRLTLYLHCATLEIAHQLDNELWTFRDIRFIPHGLVNDASLSHVALPVCIIGYPNALDHAPKADVLFNLTDEIPDFFNQYPQIVELVPTHEKSRQASRQHYKHYQLAGYHIKTEHHHAS